MKKYLKWMLVVAVAAAPAVWAAASKDDAVALVKKAVVEYKKEGKDKLIADVNKENGPFHKGDLYAFVFSLDGTVLAHPTFPDLRGTNEVEKPDVDGKMFRKEIVNGAKAGKSGWVEYKFKNPATGNIEPKLAYYEPAGDVIVISGIYKK